MVSQTQLRYVITFRSVCCSASHKGYAHSGWPIMHASDRIIIPYLKLIAFLENVGVVCMLYVMCCACECLE